MNQPESPLELFHLPQRPRTEDPAETEHQLMILGLRLAARYRRVPQGLDQYDEKLLNQAAAALEAAWAAQHSLIARSKRECQKKLADAAHALALEFIHLRHDSALPDELTSVHCTRCGADADAGIEMVHVPGCLAIEILTMVHKLDYFDYIDGGNAPDRHIEYAMPFAVDELGGVRTKVTPMTHEQAAARAAAAR